MIAALFVEKGGVYFGRPDVDPWDEERDARLYDGPDPVVCHSPCQRWSRLNRDRVNAKRWGFKMGEDGGCFTSALANVRRVGGVLEHPAESLAFAAHGLPRPKFGSWQPTFHNGWVTEVWQSAYGHRATKRTWLYCCHYGLDYFDGPAALRWERVRGTHQIGGFDPTLPNLPRRERAATPPAFAEVLIQIAESCRRV